MSKSVPATCVNGKVTAEGVEVANTVIFSQGVGPSSGLLIIDQDKSYYVAKTSPDLDATLAQVITGLNSAVSGLSAAAGALPSIAGATGDLGAIAAAAAAAASISSATGSITSAASALSTLKGMLK